MASSSRTLRAGLLIGLIAYAAVAAFYVVFDVLAARGALYTVNLLGRAVFRGLRDTGVLLYPVRLDANAILLYNGLHLVASIVIGVIVMRIIDHAEREPAHARAMLGIIIAGFVVTILAVGWLSVPIRPVLPWWSIVLANTLAVLVAAKWVVRKRPGIGRRLLGFQP